VGYNESTQPASGRDNDDKRDDMTTPKERRDRRSPAQHALAVITGPQLVHLCDAEAHIPGAIQCGSPASLRTPTKYSARPRPRPRHAETHYRPAVTRYCPRDRTSTRPKARRAGPLRTRETGAATHDRNAKPLRVTLLLQVKSAAKTRAGCLASLATTSSRRSAGPPC
jgi:hypothetical protein